MRPTLHASLLAAVLVVAACIQGSPDQGPGADEIVARQISREAPTPEHPLDIRFGEHLELLGYDLEPDEIAPGKTLRLTWYWHCIQSLEKGHQIFTHLVDATNGRMCRGCNFDDASIDNLRRIHPPGQWEVGDYIRDSQRITVPEDIQFATAEFRIGVFRETRRLHVTKGPRDGQKRARGPRFQTGFEPPPLGKLVIAHMGGNPLEIDGRLDEPAWREASSTKAFVEATNGKAGRPRTVAKLLYDDQHLYIGFDCEDDHLYSTFTKRDDHLWKQDAVEVFIDPTGRGRDYFEFQVSPAGLLFDTKVKSHPQRDDSWDGRARAAVQKRGSLNNDDDRDRGWTAELAIPLASLSSKIPRAGTQWRLNLFRLDTRRNGRRAFLAWTPPLANTTHVTARFGKITFAPSRDSLSASGGDASTKVSMDADGATPEGS